jgi:hypothetical protein
MTIRTNLEAWLFGNVCYHIEPGIVMQRMVNFSALTPMNAFLSAQLLTASNLGKQEQNNNIPIAVCTVLQHVKFYLRNANWPEVENFRDS